MQNNVDAQQLLVSSSEQSPTDHGDSQHCHSPGNSMRQIAAALSGRQVALSVRLAETRRENAGELLPEAKQLQQEAELLESEAKKHFADALRTWEGKYKNELCVCLPCHPKHPVRSAEHKRDVAPREDDFRTAQDTFAACFGVTTAVELESGTTEVRYKVRGGIGGVYNPVTGKVQWTESVEKGLSGAWNPVTQQVEWKTQRNGDAAGVFNPVTGEIEWRTRYLGGVCGVWNPVRQEAEWRFAANKGVGGVWNPLTQQVEWRECWRGGVVGYFDEKQGVVQWIERSGFGVCCVVKHTDPSTGAVQYFSSSSSCWVYSD